MRIPFHKPSSSSMPSLSLPLLSLFLFLPLLTLSLTLPFSFFTEPAVAGSYFGYNSHSGFCNQLLALLRAVPVAVYLNRTLAIPPFRTTQYSAGLSSRVCV